MKKVCIIVAAALALSSFQDRFAISGRPVKNGFEVENLNNELIKLRIRNIANTHKNKVFGIDISHYQGDINWKSLRAHNNLFNIKFMYVRATMGVDRNDMKFVENWEQLQNENYVFGAYHYYHPDANSTEQAKNFIRNVKLGYGNLPPVLDIEKQPKAISMKALKQGLRNWLLLVEQHYGIKPIIYTGEKYYLDFLKNDFSDYQFWIANYTLTETKIKDSHSIWQFTDKARVAGIDGNVDVNVFNGNIEDLEVIRKR